MTKKKGIDLAAVYFIGPAFILFTVFIIFPTIASAYYSFTSWDGISPVVKFIGACNNKTYADDENKIHNRTLKDLFRYAVAGGGQDLAAAVAHLQAADRIRL